MTRSTRADELEEFKSQINLCEYAASHGFILDGKQSSRSSAAMRHANGDKLIIARASNGHWIYFHVHDGSDQGTIIDFLQRRSRCTLGEVRKQLRPWLGLSSPIPIASRQSFADLVPCLHDTSQVLGAWLNAGPIDQSSNYLQSDRCITPQIVHDPIFADRIRIDARRNVLFPHYNQGGLCGYEVKNRGFTGYSPGGVKGLWCSRPRADDSELIICETAIDALSFAALFGTTGRRFLSTAGQISPAQSALLQAAAVKMPEANQIVLAMDNDPGGQKLAATITAALADEKPLNRAITTHLPEAEGDDWNDVLRNAANDRSIPPPYSLNNDSP